MKFEVKGYDLRDKFGKRSAGSFKLDLRYACKTTPFYSKSVDTPLVKNLGQLTFGIPNFKGLFSMRIIDERDAEADIEIYLDQRTSMFQSEIDNIIRLLREGLEILKEKGIIKDYEEVR